MSLRRTFSLLYWEGSFAMVFETWMGPTYLTGLAGELGVPVFWVSLFCSAAWIGAGGQLIGAWAVERAPSYKRYTVAVASAARGLWVLPLFFAGYWSWLGREGGARFPASRWFMLTSVVACLAALLGASSGTAWNSWVRALVPGDFRGRFFGTRFRCVMGGLVGANLLAAACVSWRPGGSYGGFALLGALGLVAAGLSTFLLSRVRDVGPPRAAGAAPMPFGEFVRGLAEPLRDRRFRGVLIQGSAFNGVLQLASPYFSYYFTRDLRIPMSRVAFWAVLTNLGCLLAAGYWGKLLDRGGDARRVLRLTGTFIGLSPLLYLPSSTRWVGWIAPFDYLTNGMFWSGYTIALSTLLFASIPPKRTALCFALYSASAGLCGAVGSLLGGRIAEWLQPWGGFRALWLAAGAARLLAAWGLYRFFRDGEADEAGDELVADYA